MWTNRFRMNLFCLLLVAGGTVLLLTSQLPAFVNQAPSPGGGVAHYTVVQTDGLHLIVTDNQANTAYFYAIDEGEKPGADLKLRGSVDLTQIGKPVIKPQLVKRN